MMSRKEFIKVAFGAAFGAKALLDNGTSAETTISESKDDFGFLMFAKSDCPGFLLDHGGNQESIPLGPKSPLTLVLRRGKKEKTLVCDQRTFYYYCAAPETRIFMPV